MCAAPRDYFGNAVEEKPGPFSRHLRERCTCIDLRVLVSCVLCSARPQAGCLLSSPRLVPIIVGCSMSLRDQGLSLPSIRMGQRGSCIAVHCSSEMVIWPAMEPLEESTRLDLARPTR